MMTNRIYTLWIRTVTQKLNNQQDKNVFTVLKQAMNSPPKGQWHGILMFSLICVWINNREAGDLRPYRAHYYVTVMYYTVKVVRQPLAGDAMMTSSNGNLFRVTGPLCGEFTGPGELPTQRPVTRSFDVFFDLRLNKRLSKQSWCWWFETPPWSLWRQCNARGLSEFSSELTWSHIRVEPTTLRKRGIYR